MASEETSQTKTVEARSVALQKDYERVANDVRSIEANNDKIIGLGISIAGAAFVYGIQYKIFEVFLAVPIALIGVFLYGVLQYNNLRWMCGYSRALQDNINDSHGVIVIYWESLLSAKRPLFNVNSAGVFIIYTIFLLGTTAFCIYHVYGSISEFNFILYMFILAALWMLLLLAVRATFSTYEKSYRASTEALGKSVAPPSSEAEL